MVSCCKLGVGIVCSYSCSRRSGHDVPVNLQKTNVILCSATFCLYVNVLLKVGALRIGYPVYFRV